MNPDKQEEVVAICLVANQNINSGQSELDMNPHQNQIKLFFASEERIICSSLITSKIEAI